MLLTPHSLVFTKNPSASRGFTGVLAKYSAHGGSLGEEAWVGRLVANRGLV